MDGSGRPSATATVVALDEQDAVPIDLDRWERLAADVLAAEDVGDTELSVTFVDEATIARLKHEHLDGDGSPTDVLSFPIDEPGTDPDRDQPGVPRLLGDVVICPEVAARQAPTHAGCLDDELALLLVHGLLHLLGHDHADDDERLVMQGRERQLLDASYGPLTADPWDSPMADGPGEDH